MDEPRRLAQQGTKWSAVVFCLVHISLQELWSRYSGTRRNYHRVTILQFADFLNWYTTQVLTVQDDTRDTYNYFEEVLSHEIKFSKCLVLVD